MFNVASKAIRASRVLPHSPLLLMSFSSQYLSEIPQGPPDKILGLNELFKADTNPKKVSLGVGAYRADDGKPLVLDCVREAEKRITEKKMDHEYAGIAGVLNYVDLSLEFAYGKDSIPIKEGRIAAVQTLSGTGACRIAGEFFARFVGKDTPIYMPNPTWGNHIPIMKNAGLTPAEYTYYNPDNCSYNHEGFMKDIESLPNGSVFLLHACAHNPTGCDPSKEQWKELSQAFLKKDHILFFDCAYQGFASGNAETDAFAIRQFVDDGHQFVLSQSFAKNFGLYGQRVGTLSVVCKDAEEKKRIDSQLKLLIRPMYSNPPVHGARIVEEVLLDGALSKKWEGECKGMADRINNMRQLLRDKLAELGSTKDWSHITNQIGMFAFTGLSSEQVLKMRAEYSIYCTEDGRISIAGVNSKNVDHIAEAIHAVSE
jgi:aspartate aminotransferase